MSITLRGVAFLQSGHADYQTGRRVNITAVITPSGGNLTAVDAGKGAAVTVAVPLTSVTYRTDQGTLIATGTLPGTIDVTFGYVQVAFEATGERTISANLSDLSSGSVAHTGDAFLTAFETYGTVFVADIEPDTPADTGVPGTGLLGRYFGNIDLTGSPVLEVVEQPYFIKVSTVHPTVPERPMSARWTGVLKTLGAGKYRFKTKCDDGARLYLDGRLVLDFWQNQNNTERLTGYYDYTAGQLVKVWIEMSNGELNATMQFSWETPGELFTLVPVTALYSTDGTEQLPPALAPPNQLRFFSEVVNRYQE